MTLYSLVVSLMLSADKPITKHDISATSGAQVCIYMFVDKDCQSRFTAIHIEVFNCTKNIPSCIHAQSSCVFALPSYYECT